MRILLSNSTDIFGGGEDYVFILAKYLRDRGHSVWVSANPGHLLLKKCEETKIGTIPIRYQGMSRVFSVAAQLRSALLTRSIEIIHSNANYDRTCAALAVTLTPMHHVASVHSAHSIQHNVTHWWRNTFGTDHFIADADAVRKVLVHEDGIPLSRITVIPLGVESDPLEFREKVRLEARSELGVTPDTVVVGNVARLVPFKGHTYLLHTIAEVVKSNRNVFFPLVGDGELMGALQKQTEELGLQQHVRFLGFRDDLNKLYPAFDIYCHSSLEMAEEAFPLAILRALATGLPVVCTNVGGIGLMVENGTSGFLTEPEDPHALAAALLKVITNAHLRRSMGTASFTLFLKNFHASAMAEQVERVYASVLSRPPLST